MFEKLNFFPRRFDNFNLPSFFGRESAHVDWNLTELQNNRQLQICIQQLRMKSEPIINLERFYTRHDFIYWPFRWDLFSRNNGNERSAVDTKEMQNKLEMPFLKYVRSQSFVTQLENNKFDAKYLLKRIN